MIDLQNVIDYLYTNNIEVRWVGDINTNTQEEVTLTEIALGYTLITAKNASDVYEIGDYNRNQNGSNLVQGIEVHIVCPKEDFRTLWITIYNLLNGYNPEPNEKLHSGFTYNHGGKVSCTDRIYHIDNWNIGFPTNKVLI